MITSEIYLNNTKTKVFICNVFYLSMCASDEKYPTSIGRGKRYGRVKRP